MEIKKRTSKCLRDKDEQGDLNNILDFVKEIRTIEFILTKNIARFRLDSKFNFEKNSHTDIKISSKKY